MNKLSSKTFHKMKIIFWVLLSVVVGIFIIFFAIFFTKKINPNKTLSAENSRATVLDSLGSESLTRGDAKYFYLNKSSSSQLKLSAEAYLVGDLNTGEVILAKNQNKQLPIASVSKLMTAYVAEETTKASDVAKVSKRALATYGENGNFRIGEKIKITDLVYPLLLESSNDAAEIIAEYFDRDSFVGKMNQLAKNLNMSSTFYEDPSGLSDNNQSTTSDLFKLTGYINQTRSDIFGITTKKNYSIKTHNWPSTNQFLRTDGYMGGKSGFTDPAKETVISLFSLPLSETGSRPIAIILLHSADRYKDVQTILKYLKKNVYYGGVADANTDWVREKIGSPDIREPDSVTFAFLGDIMLDRGVRNSVIKNFNNDYSALFDKMDVLKESDIVFANLEGSASDQGTDMHNLYSFRMDPAVIPALAGAGINMLSVANNHVGDWGRAPYGDTLARLRENEILYAGGGINNIEAEAPTIVEKYGMKIGFLGFSDVGPDWMAAKSDQTGLLLANNPRFDEIIQNASKQVDYLVVSFHFGDEYKTKHNTRQEYLAHKAVDDGAKLVIGTHPHVVEDTEVYKNSYIAYSLGNFIFDQAFSADTMQGMLLNLKLYNSGQITVRKDTVKLNKAFQPDLIIKGKEEKIKFEKAKTN